MVTDTVFKTVWVTGLGVIIFVGKLNCLRVDVLIDVNFIVFEGIYFKDRVPYLVTHVFVEKVTACVGSGAMERRHKSASRE